MRNIGLECLLLRLVLIMEEFGPSSSDEREHPITFQEVISLALNIPLRPLNSVSKLEFGIPRVSTLASVSAILILEAASMSVNKSGQSRDRFWFTMGSVASGEK